MTQTPQQPATPSGPDSQLLPGEQAEVGASRASWRSEDLLGDQTEVLIQHGSEVYRLRRTRQGKLILYK